MSLHARLHPDAQRKLDSQQRSARNMSILIAILGTTLLALVLGFFAMKAYVEEHTREFYVTHKMKDNDITPPPTVRTSVRPTPSAAGARNPVIAALAQHTLAIPVPDLVIPTETDAFGSGDTEGIGDGDLFGDGPDGRPDRRYVPPTQRCSKADRLRRLKETGGHPGVDEAVVRTLRWLKKNQHQDGSWGDHHKVGMTGLALLAYLGHCETPVSQEFGASCTDGIVYLLNLGMKNNGRLATDLGSKHWPYEHALATYALAEALSFSRFHGYNIPNHDTVVREAGQFIIDNQHPSGGWDYSYDESGKRGGDLSITGWQLQALKACSLTGLDFRNIRACTRRAMEYTEARQASNGGFGYTGTSPAGINVHSLTGVGVLALQIWDRASSRAARSGVRYISHETPFNYDTADSDLYAHYYSSQALLRHGGKDWDAYNATFGKQLLEAQNPDGSFKRPGGAGKPNAVGAHYAQDNAEGLLYRNCLCALMLEVYYRYLPGTGK
jgi:hypothetical protein